MKNVLFVCTHNAGRSQMAQAFFERYATPDMRAESGGLEPAERIHPAVVEAMAEVGIDISERRPHKLTVEMQVHADFAVTLGCEGRCPYVPTHVEDWGLPDPVGRPLAEVRSIRDEIAGRVDDLVLRRADEVRADRTAHELRLRKVLPPLIAEFDGTRSSQEIRECADAVLWRYADATIRSHLTTLAVRRTRDCLRAPGCAELEAVR
jgi:arsenate reductase (thioredoxin)